MLSLTPVIILSLRQPLSIIGRHLFIILHHLSVILHRLHVVVDIGSYIIEVAMGVASHVIEPIVGIGSLENLGLPCVGGVELVRRTPSWNP